MVFALFLLAQPAFTQVQEAAAVTKFRERLKEPGVDKAKLRQEILEYVRSWPGTTSAMQASGLLRDLPSPLDLLDAKSIPELDRFAWQPKELVAVLGEHRGRHGNVVTAVAISKDGRRVLSCGAQGYVRVFDPQTLQPQMLAGTGTATLCVAVSSDGNVVAAGNSNGGLYVWDISSGKMVNTGAFQIGTSPIYGCDISPDGKLLAAGMFDGQVHVYSLDGAKPKAILQLAGHKTPVRSVRFAPNNRTLATGSNDGVVIFWGIKGQQIDELARGEGHTGNVTGLDFSPNGSILAAGLSDGAVWFWNTSTEKPVKRTVFKAHTGAITSLRFAPNGTTVLTSGAEGSVKFWVVTATTKPSMVIDKGHVGAINGVAIAPDGKYVITGGADWTVRAWDLVGGIKERHPLKGHWSVANSVRFSPDGKLLATASHDCTARLWELNGVTGLQVAQFNPERAPLASAQFSPEGDLLAIGGSATTIHLWNVTRRSPLRTFSGHPGHVQYIFYGPDGKRIVAITGKMLVLWNAATGREITRFEIHDKRVNTATMSPDGEHVLVGSGYYEFDEKGKYIVDTAGNYKYTDCEVLLWELRGGRKVQEQKKLERPVSSLSYTPDSKHAACTLWNYAQLMWDVSPEELKRQPALKELPANTVGQTYSPDGKRFITVSSGHTIYLCDAAAGKPVWQWTPQEYVTGIAFSPDGRYLAVSIVTGPVYILRMEKSPETASP